MRYFILLCVVIATTAVHAQTSLPSISVVKKEFYTNYDVSGLEYPAVAFEKRKAGWYIGVYKIEGTSITVNKHALFYDRKTKKYVDLPLVKQVADGDEQKKMYLNTDDDYQYKVNYYYGYDGWYNDVVKDLKDKPSLTSDELFSLARAYSTTANALLSGQLGFVKKDETFITPLIPNCLTPYQLKTYNRAMEKAQATFLMLKKKDPGFETLVGTIAMKYANEIMVQFHNTLVYADSSAASMELPENLYPDSVINKVKAILNECDSNSILVSLGDNDFYPVLYVQHILNTRRDVYLINTNLLGVDRYIARATYPQFSSPGIKLSIDTSVYKGRLNDYLFVEKSEKPIHFSEVLKRIENNFNVEERAPTLPSDVIIINDSSLYDKQQADTMPKVSVALGYIMKDEWILLDIIKNLNGRKIYSQSQLYNGLSSLNEYLKLDKLLYRYEY